MDVGVGIAYDTDDVKVTAFEVDHIKPVSFGYRIDFNGRSVVLSGDTRYSENLIRHAQGADVIVHEVAFGTGALTAQQQVIVNGHTTPDRAADVFNVTKPQLAIYSHVILLGTASDDDVIAATKAKYSGRVEMGHDLTTVEIGDRVSLRRLP
jgi:ribonuclease Z